MVLKGAGGKWFWQQIGLIVGKTLLSDWCTLLTCFHTGQNWLLHAEERQKTLSLHCCYDKWLSKPRFFAQKGNKVAVCFCNQEWLHWSDFKIDFSASKPPNKTSVVNPFLSAPQSGLCFCCGCGWLSRLVSLHLSKHHHFSRPRLMVSVSSWPQRHFSSISSQSRSRTGLPRFLNYPSKDSANTVLTWQKNREELICYYCTLSWGHQGRHAALLFPVYLFIYLRMQNVKEFIK